MKDLENKKYLVTQVLKAIKKSLPKACTYLSLYTRKDGLICLRAVIHKNELYYSIPQDFNLTEASYERIRSLLFEVCKPI
jgi:hypothetical protein